MESYHDQPNVALYRELQQRFPDYFAAYSGLQIITDEKQMRAFTEETGKELGVVFDNRPFYFVVCDLVENAGKKRFRYARIIGANADVGSGTIIVPTRVQDGRLQFGLLKIYRHSFRGFSYEFPRGFQDAGISAEENAKKELCEELGSRVERVMPLGIIRGDTGMAGGAIQVYQAHIGSYAVTSGYEGIETVLWVDEAEFCRMLASDEIFCGLTAAAYAKFAAQRAQTEQKGREV